jgi:prophage regulatory protein
MNLDYSFLNVTSTRLIVRLDGVRFQTGLTKSTIYDKIKEGTFPKPLKLGARAVGWLQSDINAWIDRCVAKA